MVIASSSDFSTSVHAAAKASASGYGIEASGAMSQVTQGDLSTQSGGVYLQAYSNEVGTKSLFHYQASEMEPAAIAAFKAGPESWSRMNYPVYFVTHLLYGGYFNGGYTFTSKTTSSNSAFDAAASISGSGWGVSASAQANYQSTRTEYQDSVSLTTMVECSPSGCLDLSSSNLQNGVPSTTAVLPAAIQDSYINWYNGLKGGQQVSAIRVASLADTEAFAELRQEALSPNNSWGWTESSIDSLFQLPTASFMQAWVAASVEAQGQHNAIEGAVQVR